MIVRNLFLSLVFLCFMFSCKSNVAKANKNTNSVEQIVSKLNSNDTIQLLDLSYKNIKQLPDLSRFKVVKLNISHNNLDTLVMKNLPTYLVDLDASYNKIKKGMNFINIKEKYKGMYNLENNISNHIKKINLSNNEIRGISFFWHEKGIDRINISNNKLESVNLYLEDGKLNYLDVSNNKKLSNRVKFNPTKIDTIKSNNIAIDAPLELIKIDKNALLKRLNGQSYDPIVK